jgi:nucleotide-binding universal stress UspA family protein
MVIVVGLDDSDSAWRAVAYAVGLARRQRASRLVFVDLGQRTGMYSSVPEVIPYARNAHKAVVTNLRDRLRAEVGGADLDWEYRIEIGNSRARLQSVADDVRADLVVAGAPQHSKRRLGRPVGVWLIGRRRWPVLIIP